MRRLIKILGAALIRRVTRRKPDVIIGGADDPYMLRWWVIPRNRFFNIYLHRFLRSDDERALHDHPWINLSILLEGTYVEVTPVGKDIAEILRHGERVRGVKFSPRMFEQNTQRTAGSLVLRKATSAHRIKLYDGFDGKPLPVWTLFLTGPVRRTWGFHCPQGWRKWTDFTANHENVQGQIESKVARGCD